MKPSHCFVVPSSVGLAVVLLLASCSESGGGGGPDPGPAEPESPAITGDVYSFETGMIDGATLLVSAVDKDGAHWSYLPDAQKNALPKSDANGRFAVAADMGLPASITVLAEREGFVQPCRVSTSADAGADVRVEMVPVSAFDAVNPAPSQSSGGPSVTGVIYETTEQGRVPVAGATVRVEESLPDGAELAYFQNHSEQLAVIRVAKTRSDLAGGFFVCNLGPPVFLRVSKVGYEEQLIGPIDASTSQDLEIQLAHPLPPGAAEQLAFVREGQVYVVNTDGSGLVRVTDGPDDGEPAWSADGNRIAFTRRSGETTDIYIVNADGSNLVQRTDCGSTGYEYNGTPSWSPDGAWIAFTRSCGSGSAGIYRMKADDDGTDPVPIVDRPGYDGEPAWSPDGTRIAFSSDWFLYDFAVDIYVSDLAGLVITQLTSGYGDFTEIEYYHPAWSPDGLKLAVLGCQRSFVTCTTGKISVMKPDGTGLMHVADASSPMWPTWTSGPSWSPDGKFIAYGSSGSIHWVSADGNTSGVIIGDGHSPSWRPSN